MEQLQDYIKERAEELVNTEKYQQKIEARTNQLVIPKLQKYGYTDEKIAETLEIPLEKIQALSKG